MTKEVLLTISGLHYDALSGETEYNTLKRESQWISLWTVTARDVHPIPAQIVIDI